MAAVRVERLYQGDFQVSSLLYRDHTIRYGATLDQNTKRYNATVEISWQTIYGQPDRHSFVVAKPCSTMYEAKELAVQEAIAWADRRLVHLGP
jgi:hypothetical protein